MSSITWNGRNTSTTTSSSPSSKNHNNNTNNTSLSGLLESPTSSSRRKLRGSSNTVAGDQMVISMKNGGSNNNNTTTSQQQQHVEGEEESEIYIRADGKKVRRIKRTISIPKRNDGTTPIVTTNLNCSSSNNNSNTTSTTSTSEVYVRPDGKKVRRLIRTKSSSDHDDHHTPSSSSNTNVKSSNLHNFLHTTSSSTTKPTTFRGSATVVGNETGTNKQGDTTTTMGEIYIRPDGKKVRRIKKMTSSTTLEPSSNNTTTTMSSSNSSNGGGGGGDTVSTVLLDDSLTSSSSSITKSKGLVVGSTTDGIYINAEGKKVRRIVKQNSTIPSTTTTTTTPTTANPVKLGGFLNTTTTDEGQQHRGSASVSGSQPSKNLGEIYINAEGKKVRRVLKTKSTTMNHHTIVDSNSVSNSTKTDHAAATSTVSSGNQNDITTTASATIKKPKSNTIAEGEIYIRPDGKKVRRVKRSNSNLSVTSSTTSQSSVNTSSQQNHPIDIVLDRPSTPPSSMKKSLLDGYIAKTSPKKITSTLNKITGSATVAGDRVSTKIDGGEIYINADGKKVRRVRKSRPITTNQQSESSTTTAATPPTTTTNIKNTTTTHLGVTQSILQERAAKQKANADAAAAAALNNSLSNIKDVVMTTKTTSKPIIPTIDTEPKATNTSLSINVSHQQDDHSMTVDVITPKISNDYTSTKTPIVPPSLLVQSNVMNTPLSAITTASNFDETSTPKLIETPKPTTFTTPSNITNTTKPPSSSGSVTTETSEIYINADGKKVRRIRRSNSNISTSSETIPPATSNSTLLNHDTQQQPPQLGEIYIRADGKKVRRVRRNPSTNSVQSSLGGFLQQDSTMKSNLSGSATVVGDRKLDGEIIIRPDGKKVIRRARSKMGSSSASVVPGDTSTTNNNTPSSLSGVGEIFRNADGKLVRRVKRTPSTSVGTGPTTTPNSSHSAATKETSPQLLNMTNLPHREESKVSPNTTPSKSMIQLTDDEETIAKVYRKMKNMGIPDDAVRHKMVVSEVHPKIIAAVMGDDWNEASTTESPKIQSGISISLSADEDSVAATYRKMQNMGLPEDAVRHKMIMNDVAPKIVAAVLGESWKEKNPTDIDSTIDSPTPKSTISLTGGEEAIAGVYRKLQRMGLSDDAIRHKMTTSDVHPKIIAAVLGDEWTDETPEKAPPILLKSPQLNSEEEEIAAQFRKLRNIGFSDDAIRHKMILSEVSPKIMAAVLGEEWSEEIPSQSTGTGPAISGSRDTQEAASISSPQNVLSSEEDMIIAQYRKMQQMGLPDDAVRHKMIVNDVDPKIITAFFSDINNPTNRDSTSSTVQSVPNSIPKTNGAVAYVVVVGDEPAVETARPGISSDQSVMSLNSEEKFAVKVADESNPTSSDKITKFFTLEELAQLSGQSKDELEEMVKEKRRRGASPPKFSLLPLDEPKYEVSLPTPTQSAPTTNDTPSSSNGVGNDKPTPIKEGQEVVDSELAKAARAVTALGEGDMSKLLEKLQMGDMKDLLEKLAEAEKRQKKLEKQLAQAGVAIAEDIEYKEALGKVEQIAKRMNEIGGSDVVLADKEEQNRLREEYFKLEQEMERYNTALVLSEEYQAEQDRMELKWEKDNEPLNLEALKKIRRHMPVNIRHLSEADLTTKPSPNGKYLPVAIAKKFKRTNILQCLRLNPDDLECMHPATLENMRVTGLTLTERRALYIHFKPVGPKWEKNKAEKMTERKWTWYQMMRNNFKENVAPYQRHIDQYGGPENHTCPLIGKQCPIRADKNPDYDGDYGWTEAAEYEVSDVRKADVEDSGAKAKAEALGLAKEKKANERADLLKKHYKGKLLQVSKANGSCEGMDEAMDQMENHTLRWTENMLDKLDFSDADKKKEVANFMDALNEFKLKLLNFAQRSGMQMTGKKTAGGDSIDIRSSVEASLSEEVYESTIEFFTFIRMRLKQLDIVDTRCIKTIELLEGILKELHTRNVELFQTLGVKRMNRSRKLKTNADLKKEVEDKKKGNDADSAPEEETSGGHMGPPPGGGGRGGLLDAIAGRGPAGGRGGLLDAIAGRGRGRGGGRGGLLDAIAAGRGDKGRGGRGGLLDAIAGRGASDGDGGGRGNLMAAIAGRGGRAPGGGRGGLMAAIAARGGGGNS